MRPIYIYLISSIGMAACGMTCTQQAHAQLSQALKDYKYDRPLQYAPDDPWTRSALFNRQTKHYGFGYNCDGEECKRNSPYICWKNHTENDLPCKTGCWRRLNQTVAEVKQRIADGNCVKCAQCDPCKNCQQGKCGGCGGCSDCQSLPSVTMATNEMESVGTEELVIPKPPYEVIDTSATQPSQTTRTITSLPSEPKLNRQVSTPVRTAGLESLNTRVK